jgi:hypothetical protein
MNNEAPQETTGSEKDAELSRRRLFLQTTGKWSGAAIVAAVFGAVWLAISPEAKAGWINRRGYGGGGGWINGRGGWGGGGWINRGGGGGGWINRRGGGGGWINR